MSTPHPDQIDGSDQDHHVHDHVQTPPAVPIEHSHWHVWPARKTVKAKLGLVPGFGWLLLLYFLGTLFLDDPYHVVQVDLPGIGIWKSSWVTFIIGLAPLVVAVELTNLSQPGVNQMDEVIAIGVVFVVQIILVTVAFATNHIPMFKTSEGLLLMIANGIQTWAAYKINANSLIRTFAPGPVTT